MLIFHIALAEFCGRNNSGNGLLYTYLHDFLSKWVNNKYHYSPQWNSYFIVYTINFNFVYILKNTVEINLLYSKRRVYLAIE